MELPRQQAKSVNLRTTKQRWVRYTKREKDLSDENRETREIFRKFLGILNKITPQKFKYLAEQALKLPLSTVERLKGCIEILFKKAINEPMYSVVYANLGRVMSPIKIAWVTEDGKDQSTGFRRELVSKCQQAFEKDKKDDEERKRILSSIEEAETSELKKELQRTLEVWERIARKESQGSIRFIGEMFKLRMLSESAMHDCIVRLLRSSSDEGSIECFCVLIMTTGKDLDMYSNSKMLMDKYFKRINDIISKKKISLRVKFMLQYVQEARKNDWVARRQLNQLKTIDQIHREAKEEQQKEQEMIKQMKKKDAVMYKDDQINELQKENTHLVAVNVQLREQNAAVVGQLEKEKATAIAQVEREKATAIAQVVEDKATAIAQFEEEKATAIAQVKREKATAIAQFEEEKATAIAQVEEEKATAIAHVEREKDIHIAQLQEEVRQLQSRIEQQPKLGDDSDISFWLISHEEVHSSGQFLGKGGWGSVTVGRFRGQSVAVKELHSSIRSPYFDELLRREISLMAKIRHPNLLLFIAAVLDKPGRSDPIIITELLDTDLRKAYQDGQLANNRVRLFILRDVATALNYLHLQRDPIIHRDVTSANVLLQALPENQWRGKLSDFGSANIAKYASTPAPGNLQYTAPEALRRDEKQSTKMDVYSYGMLFCEVIINQFPDPRAFPSMMKSMADNWPLMHRMTSSCVEHDPTMRPTMSSIVDQLNKILDP